MNIFPSQKKKKKKKDAQVAIDTSIGLFCAASCSQLNANKSQAFLVQSQPLASTTVDALPSISFITGQQTVRHLGVCLGYDMSTACHQTFAGIHQAIKAKARHWSARGLSFLGRVHVAKQVMDSKSFEKEAALLFWQCILEGAKG